MAGIQQILLGMGGAGGDTYWQGLYSWGTQSGTLANNFYGFNGVDIDPDDNVYVAGQRNRTHTYYNDAIFAKLDIDGALQAQIRCLCPCGCTHTTSCESIVVQSLLFWADCR